MSKQTHERLCTASARRNATLFAALGDETRLQLLLRLRTGESQSIKQLTLGLPITRQAVTKHLRVLENANFVMQKSHGRERRFIARQAAIDEAQAALESIGQQWDEALIRLKNFIEES